MQIHLCGSIFVPKTIKHKTSLQQWVFSTSSTILTDIKVQRRALWSPDRTTDDKITQIFFSKCQKDSETCSNHRHLFPTQKPNFRKIAKFEFSENCGFSKNVFGKVSCSGYWPKLPKLFLLARPLQDVFLLLQGGSKFLVTLLYDLTDGLTILS